MSRVYISGPISTDLPHVPYEERKARFDRAEKSLRRLGHETVNPLTVHACSDRSCGGKPTDDEHGGFLHTWKCYMKYDLIALLDCDVIGLLPHWNLSSGAACEYQVAHRLGFEEWRIGKNGEILAHSIL